MAAPQNVPLVVDLDGTLLRTDMMWESLARRLRRNPFAIFQILFWWTRGRARLKQKLAARVHIEPAALPCNEKFLAWLRDEKKTGRKIILATASDLQMARPIADHVGLFDEVLASDGITNLRSENKLRVLTAKYGARGFDYAGNSSADFAVWRGAREAVVVNASPGVLREAAKCAPLGPVFCENFSHFAVAKNVGKELFLRSGYLVAIVAGLLMASAFPKLSLAGFAWIAPALMVYAARGKTGADALRVGFVSGFTFWLASLYWLLLIPVAGYPILGWVLLAAYNAVFMAVWTWFVAASFRPNGLMEKWIDVKSQPSSNPIIQQSAAGNSWSGRTRWAVGGAAAWAALEMLRACLLGGFPWNFLGVSQYQLVPLIQIAAFTGVYGVSFLVVWFSLALFSAAQMIFLHPTKHWIWQAEIVLPLTVTMACFVGGFFTMNRSVTTGKFLRVTMIQPAIPQFVIWNPGMDENIFRKFLAQNEAALTNETDLLIWPESAVPQMSEENCRAISALAREHHLWLILNGEHVTVTPDATNYFNAAFLVNPQGNLTRTYHKQKLVIFGEYVPLLRWLPFLQWFTPITGGWTAGEKSVTFEMKHGWESESRSRLDPEINLPNAGPDDGISIKTAPLICYEDMFPATTRDAAQDDLDFLVNLTNDGWFGNRGEQWQHMAGSVFRSVENGLPLLRCCNNGVTCWIDGRGRVENVFRNPHGDEYAAGALTVKIPLLSSNEKSTGTFYNRHGDWFGWGCVGISAGMVCSRILVRRKKK